jgi:type I restriction enzyme S subunit
MGSQVSSGFEQRVVRIVQSARALREQTTQKQAEAEQSLLNALGLADWSPPVALTYTARANDAFAAGRLDAQYYMPAKEQVRQSLASLPGLLLRGPRGQHPVSNGCRNAPLRTC